MTDLLQNFKTTQTGVVTMAFDIAQPSHPKRDLAHLQLTRDFAIKLMELSDLLKRRKSNLRIQNLRGRLQIADQSLLSTRKLTFR